VNVGALFIYPVKSCRGIALHRAELGLCGLSLDRRWMVTRPDGAFVTQRELPGMALIDVALSGDELVLASAGHGSIRVPLRYDAGQPSRVKVWRDELWGGVHAHGSRWISRALGGDYQLVYMPDTSLRPVSPEHGRSGDVVSFADAYPLLLVTEASLGDLNSRLPQPIGVERFRPNVVIAGASPYAEDGWQRIALGGVEFRVPKGCDRCTIPSIDPRTGERGKEPLSTLARYRKWDGKVWFGVNLIPDGSGALGVGDELHVLA
jgi:uncharacterized protein